MANVNNYSAYVGLDVHKDTIAVAIASPERQGEVRFWGTYPHPKILSLG